MWIHEFPSGLYWRIWIASYFDSSQDLESCLLNLKYEIGIQTPFSHVFVQHYANIISGVKLHKDPWEQPIDAGHILQSLAEFAFLSVLYP